MKQVTGFSITSRKSMKVNDNFGQSLGKPRCHVSAEYVGTRLELNCHSNDAGLSLTFETEGGKTESAITSLKLIHALVGTINLDSMVAASSEDSSGEISRLSGEIRSMVMALDNSVVDAPRGND